MITYRSIGHGGLAAVLVMGAWFLIPSNHITPTFPGRAAVDSHSEPSIEKIDGASFERIGASAYMLDESGRQISGGYHAFVKLDDHFWIGRIGAMSYLLKDGKSVSDGYHVITRTATGYNVSIGAQSFKLDKNGKKLS